MPIAAAYSTTMKLFCVKILAHLDNAILSYQGYSEMQFFWYFFTCSLNKNRFIKSQSAPML